MNGARLPTCLILALCPMIIAARVWFSRGDPACREACRDLPAADAEPVCMMFSRYKRSYQFFANMCQARRAVCQDNLFLHLVHPSRCLVNRQYFMPLMRAATEKNHS